MEAVQEVPTVAELPVVLIQPLLMKGDPVPLLNAEQLRQLKMGCLKVVEALQVDHDLIPVVHQVEAILELILKAAVISRVTNGVNVCPPAAGCRTAIPTAAVMRSVRASAAVTRWSAGCPQTHCQI